MNFSDIKLVSWDMDGTLYSRPRLYLKLMKNYCKESLRGNWLSISSDMRLLKESRQEFEMGRQFGVNLNGLRDQQVRLLEKKHFGRALEELGPRRQVIEALKYFQTREIPQVVLSDFEADYKVKALGLEDYFKGVWSGELTGEFKPSPRAFRRVEKIFNVEPGQHLHIGDRKDTDGMGARQAGCHFIHVRKLPRTLAQYRW